MARRRHPVRGAITLILASAVMAACGGAPESPSGATTSAPNQEAASEQGGWWLYEEPGYSMVDGGLTPPDISGATGSLWRLEYSGSGNTIQLSADRSDSLFARLSAGSPQVGTAPVDGFEAVLRQHPGDPEDGIPPTVGAEWTDGDLFVSFGGGGLSEAELRAHLSHVSRVPRAEWEAAVEVAQERQRRVREENPTETTRGLPPIP